MADYNVDELSELVKADILAESQGVGEVPVVTSLSGINSLPALMGNEVVEAPLSLLSKPAEDAAKAAYAAIGNVQTATDNAMKAATSANQAAERVEDSILDLQEEKQIIAGVDAAEKVRVASENERIANENARKEAENARSSAETARENRETARQTAETARASAENDRAAAEKSRDNSEKGRATAESSRVSAENVRRSNEVARENTHAEMKALNKELKENPPRINADGNWELWDAAEKTYHDTKQTALGKSPIIVDGIWWIWNDDKDDFESTGWAVNSDFVLTKKNVTDALGYTPVSPTQLANRIDQLFTEDALDILKGSDVLAIQSGDKKATVTVDMLKSFFNTYDLSRHDIYGNAIKQTTANCYVVKSKGYYSFPLVYGNALKDGEVNTPAFTKVEGTYSMDFVNHLDNVITSPYIEQHEGCQPVSVELSLCDTKDVFGAFRLVGKDDCTYVEFEVINVPKTGANGVVSVIDANGDAIWSWHIWLWEDDLTPVTITNATNVNYDILPVNLASKWDEDSKKHIKNWFYQWGRHIPMLSPSAYNSTTDAANYGKRAFGKVSKAASYGVGLKKPWNFYYSGSSDSFWFSNSPYYNLWDATCVRKGESDNSVVKTIYDPAPIGYKMPNGNVFSYFSFSNVVGSFSNGWYFKKHPTDNKGIYFPASGCRTRSVGDNYNVGYVGYVWKSSIDSATMANSVRFTSSAVASTSAQIFANGYSVRPVKE